MNTVLLKLIFGQEVTREDIYDALYDICDSVHARCDWECPVHEINGGPVNPDRPFDENRGCDCFKNGRAMFEFIVRNSNSK